MPLTVWDFVWSDNYIPVQMASWLLHGHQFLLPGMLVLLSTLILGSKYLLTAKTS